MMRNEEEGDVALEDKGEERNMRKENNSINTRHRFLTQNCNLQSILSATYNLRVMQISYITLQNFFPKRVPFQFELEKPCGLCFCPYVPISILILFVLLTILPSSHVCQSSLFPSFSFVHDHFIFFPAIPLFFFFFFFSELMIV